MSLRKSAALFLLLASLISSSAFAGEALRIRLADVDNAYFKTSPKLCWLHLEVDSQAAPARLTYTWSGASDGTECKVEGVTHTVACTEDFICGPIYLLPDGNITLYGRRYQRD